jgi:hypothetical protein
MGKRQKRIFGRVRILEKVLGNPIASMSLQYYSVAPQLQIGWPQHTFASEAAFVARHHISAQDYVWSRQVHRWAATERHNVFLAESDCWSS